MREMPDTFCRARFMNTRRYIAWTQVPREAYLVSRKQKYDTLFPSCARLTSSSKRASRFTSDEAVFVNDAGSGGIFTWLGTTILLDQSVPSVSRSV